MTRSAFAAACALACAATIDGSAGTLAQSMELRLSPAGVRLRVAALGLLEGRVLERLRDGRTVKVVMALDILARPSTAPIARASETCTFSFDLWEERFAVSIVGPSPRSISHLRSDDAEAWCVDQLVVPLADLGSGAQGRSFWVTLDAMADDPSPSSTDVGPGDGFWLQRLIERLSQRSRDSVPRRTMQAGPLSLSP